MDDEKGPKFAVAYFVSGKVLIRNRPLKIRAHLKYFGVLRLFSNKITNDFFRILVFLYSQTRTMRINDVQQ